MNKISCRLRRSRKTRIKIYNKKITRLSIHRTNLHIYAQIFSSCGKKVLASASTIEKEMRIKLNNKSGKGGNINAAILVGQRIAEKAKILGIKFLAFDRSGFYYHGRIKALANAAREAGLKF